MIYINLLPEELRPIKRTPIPYILSGLVFLGVLAGIAMLHLNMALVISQEQAAVEVMNQEYAELKDIVDRANELVAMKKNLQSKIQTIDEIVANRIIWSEQLYNMSRLLPDNFWYENIEVESRRDTRIEYTTDPKTGERKQERIPYQRRVLVISGYVVDSEDGNDVTPLIRNIDDDEDFSALFDMQPPSLSDTLFDGIPVKSFTLEFDILQGTGGA